MYCGIIWNAGGREREDGRREMVDFRAASESHYRDSEAYVIYGSYPLRSQGAYWLFGRVSIAIHLLSWYAGWGILYIHPIAYTVPETVAQSAFVCASLSACVSYSAYRRVEANAYVEANCYTRLEYDVLEEESLRVWAPFLTTFASCALFLVYAIFQWLVTTGRLFPSGEPYLFAVEGIGSCAQLAIWGGVTVLTLNYVCKWDMDADIDHLRRKQHVGLDALRLHEPV